MCMILNVSIQIDPAFGQVKTRAEGTGYAMIAVKPATFHGLLSKYSLSHTPNICLKTCSGSLTNFLSRFICNANHKSMHIMKFF